MDKAMALKPRVSEKAYGLSLERNTYVFGVPMDANKQTVSAAVSTQFNVTVEDVRLSVVKGKTKRSYKKGRRPVVGKRADFKKAYVRVKEGDSINIFGEEDKKANKDAKKSETVSDKKATAKTEAQPKRGLRGALSRTPRQTQNRGGDK